MVQGAKNTDDAIMLAKSICNSALVKTAIHGCDPNWGRIISAAGNSGVKFNFNDVDLYIGNAQILEKGKINKYDLQKVTDYIKSRMKGRYLVDDTVKIIINCNYLSFRLRSVFAIYFNILFRKIAPPSCAFRFARI